MNNMPNMNGILGNQNDNDCGCNKPSNNNPSKDCGCNKPKSKDCGCNKQ